MVILKEDIKSKHLVIELSYFTNMDLEDFNTRRYYDSELNNGKKCLLLSSDEPNNPEEKHYKIIKESYIVIPNFKELVKDFEFSKFTNYHIQKGFNSPPKYTYYQINFIHDKYKTLFLQHLTESVLAYSKGDLSEDEELNIFLWKEYLTNNN